jgi:hypothetical protein
MYDMTENRRTTEPLATEINRVLAFVFSGENRLHDYYNRSNVFYVQQRTGSLGSVPEQDVSFNGALPQKQ